MVRDRKKTSGLTDCVDLLGDDSSGFCIPVFEVSNVDHRRGVGGHFLMLFQALQGGSIFTDLYVYICIDSYRKPLDV